MISHSNSFGQLTDFDELSNELFFNIFINRPHSAVFDFVKKYFPAFTEEFEPGGWTIYPPDPPELQHTIHSLKFTEHPYIDVKFREGRLDILASERKDSRPGVTDYHLWFMFDTFDDAKNAFAKLSAMFDVLSKSKNVFELNGKTIAEYSDHDVLEQTNSVQFVLTKDELHDDTYKLFFRIGSFTYSD